MAKSIKRRERKTAKMGHFDYEKFVTDLSKRIKTIRKQKGFSSYEHFSYDIGISRASMAKFDSGNFSDIRIRTLLLIIDGLGLTPKEFFSEGFD